MTFQPEDISRLIKETVTALNPKASGKGLTLTADLPDVLSPVNIDNHRIKQVLYNLLENAIAHTPRDGKINVTAREHNNMVYISVSDTGEGIPPEDLPMIFERFYRVDKSRTRATGGSGLGSDHRQTPGRSPRRHDKSRKQSGAREHFHIFSPGAVRCKPGILAYNQ